MNKYTFVVLGSGKDDFLARLQELGLVDVTVTGRELSEEDRALVRQIESHREAVEYLSGLLRAKGFVAGKPYDTGAEALEKYEAARREMAATEGEIARREKLADEARAWDGVDLGQLRTLVEHGVPLEVLMEEAGIDSPEDVRIPAESSAEIDERLAGLRAGLADWSGVLARAVATLPAVEADAEKLKDRLQFRRTTNSGTEAADGALVVMEAWAREKEEHRVDAMLEEHPGVIYIKEKPTPEDETPVELHNGRFASPFEFIGDLYAKPRYGTMDLTRWFAPFFMLFFGMCMGDLGYGTLIFSGGLAVALISKKEGMRQIGRLTMWCGGAAMVIGFLMGGFFGTSLADRSLFEGIKKIFISSDTMFYLAIAIGIFQVMFAMVLNVVTTVRAFGLQYALATIGWLIVLATCIAAFGLQYLGAENFAAGEMFAPGSVAFWGCFGAGMVLLLFFNSPGENILVNFGGGLWALFNRLTGLLGDALSYIRLFAIGLSGGVLALVFNRIAVDMSPDIPVAGQLVTLLILLVGHSLNLFLSTLSAIVHPLRLTFVEFFNNAGFEAGERAFAPLKHSAKDENDITN